MATPTEPEAQKEEEREGPLFSNSYELFNAILDDVNALEKKCNNVKTIGDVVMFRYKSSFDLFKIKTELEYLKHLLEQGR
jgi:hypothetical protein